MTIQAITPVRILDTRPSKGGAGPFAAGETRTLQVLGRGAVPLSGVAAIIGNATVLSGASGGYLTLWPAGYQMPTASNINFPAGGQPLANQFVCALGPTGAISLFDGFAPGTNVIIDVQGWIPADPLRAVGPSVPFELPSFGWPTDTMRAELILKSATDYLLNVWWPGPAQTLMAADLGYAGAAGNHDAVRRLAMAALGLSTGVAAHLPGADPASAMLVRTVQIVDRVAGAHVTNALGGWGEGWQTPMWAAICARAAWFNWDAMPAMTRAAVARMVAHEADYAARRQLHYLRDAAGTVLTPGDTGAEEVSWWGLAMQVAQVMLPEHSNVPIWSTEMQRYALAAAARPQDVATWSTTITGSNVEVDGTVVNHGRVASDYATCLLYQNADAIPLFALAGRPTPQAMRQLSAPVYAAFTGASPATYVSGTGGIFYPQGNDWGTGQVLPYALADAQALAYGYDSGTAAFYLGLHLDAVLAQQARFTDGHTYLNDAEYNYEGREEHTAQLAAQLWLTLYLRDREMVSFD